MLNIVCFKWQRPNRGVILPSQRMLEYGPRHVNTLFNMLRRNVRDPFRLICVTDNANGIDKRVEVVPMWSDHRDMGGCYTRLKVFSPAMRELLGDRFMCIDLDCVIVGDITPLLHRKEELVINSFNGQFSHDPDQYYNGGMILMTAGARSDVYDTFAADPKAAHEQIQRQTQARVCIGSDQAWMRLVLGKSVPRFSNNDGVYEARQFRYHLPKNARIMFFAGKRDPSLSAALWVRRNWR